MTISQVVTCESFTPYPRAIRPKAQDRHWLDNIRVESPIVQNSNPARAYDCLPLLHSKRAASERWRRSRR
jgi:hypothetical protein